MNKTFTLYIRFFLLLFAGMVIFMSSSCRKMEDGVDIPVYFKIDSVAINTFYLSEGSPSAKITDVWVYVDDRQMGVFELPAKFPLLFEGKHRVEIRPGIKLNGISSTRVPYPFYKPIIYYDFDFVPDSVYDFGTITTGYYDNLNFIWMEDFESSVISLEESSSSDTTIERTMPADNPEAFLSEHSRYSGVITLTPDRPNFMAYSFNAFDLPKDDSPVLMEMNFKTNHPLLVGVLVDDVGDYSWEEVVYLKETSNWNKIYINIGPVTSRYPNAYGFKIYLAASLSGSDTEAKIYVDNIKLIHRKK